ncbi:MAG TPA: MBL fold metallo-hydrolase [Stellaceae bacterium]|nr:MBL fold metallo-hydrolase [Stellaceae bacterium]
MTSPLGCVVVPVTPFAQNASILWCTETMRGAVIDPGGDIDRLLDAAKANGVTIEKILLTHGHLDHAGGAADLVDAIGVPIEGPQPEDAFLLDSLAEQGARFGLAGCRPCRPNRWLKDGEQVTIGTQSLDVLHCPGHTPGHVVFSHPATRFAIVGDTLFRGSIGRTDLPGGDTATLLRAIVAKLWPLGDDVAFIPGHGPGSTIGEERRGNPFVGDEALKRAAR